MAKRVRPEDPPPHKVRLLLTSSDIEKYTNMRNKCQSLKEIAMEFPVVVKENASLKADIQSLRLKISTLETEVETLMNNERETVSAAKEEQKQTWDELRRTSIELNVVRGRLDNTRKDFEDYKKKNTRTTSDALIQTDTQNVCKQAMKKRCDFHFFGQIHLQSDYGNKPTRAEIEGGKIQETLNRNSEIDHNDEPEIDQTCTRKKVILIVRPPPPGSIDSGPSSAEDVSESSSPTSADCGHLFSSSPRSSPYIVPVQARTWFEPAFEYLNVAELGSPYLQFVQQWIGAEAATGWRSTQRGMPGDQRPVELTRWRGGNNAVDRYKASNEKTPTLDGTFAIEFSASVWAWWGSIQPTWRGVDLDSLRPRPFQHFGSEWKSLNRWGPNGWVLLLVCIKWWGVSLRQLEDDNITAMKDDWETAIADMSMMLQGVTEYRVQSVKGSQNNTGDTQ
ncbi:SERTA domain-containing protein 3 [Paramarasmius palmivorus]|uniref:SERTA domain-containing protein 3 n=1 Tax=Paramarasmius palmivorus TaxID=297713 RepID=A0AAW0AWP4_9AGAR